MDRLAVDNMTLDEINDRLLRAFRNGLLSMDLKGVVLGFARAMKRGKPSLRQTEIARKLVREIRYHDGSEPVDLIDREDTGDNPEAAEMALNYAEFR